MSRITFTVPAFVSDDGDRHGTLCVGIHPDLDCVPLRDATSEENALSQDAEDAGGWFDVELTLQEYARAVALAAKQEVQP